jgi:DNA-binding response OmpR family regulator
MSKIKILLVEDDFNLGFIIKDQLEIRNYEIHWCTDGTKAWGLFTEHDFDLCILDIMLPGKNGFELIKYIREKNENIPVIFLSARALNEDKITGLKLGADDYIVKPFSMEELTLRIEVFIKRTKKNISPKNILKISSYTFDYPNQELIHPIEKISLTKKEADIINYLSSNIDTTVKREDILKLVWGDDDYFMGRSLDVYLSKIRKYFRHDSKIEIVNVFAVGFRLVVRQNE